MLTTVVIVLGIFLIALLIFDTIWYVHSRRFRPTADRMVQLHRLNSDLNSTGFAYDAEGDYFYSLMNCWQREMGYCRLYDEGAPVFQIIADCEPVAFSYGGKRWLIELWKGQYGIAAGGEIGVYNTTQEDVECEEFKGTFYKAAKNEERLKMSFTLRRNDKVICRRKGLHWWLTGFRVGEFSSVESLRMDVKITFLERVMCKAFTEALMEMGYSRQEFSARGKKVRIIYDKPHSPQPFSRNTVQEELAQKINKKNCRLYENASLRYPYTMDKLEYLKAAVPEVYDLFLKSLYSPGFYDGFKWIKESGR